MCSVQVLIFAEEQTRRPFDENVLPPRARGVCRRLFADDSASNRDSASRVLRDLQTKINEETRDRWNFDFERGVPLKGKFQWTPVWNENVVCKRPLDSVTKKSSAKKRPSSSPTSPAHKKCKTVSSSQSKITDFLQSKKQSSPSSSKKHLRTANSSPSQRSTISS